MIEKASTLLMFGATGDLARRMLLPSLYGLDADGLLPDDLRIVGTARTELDDAAFRERANGALREHLPPGFYEDAIAQRFLSRLQYVPLDINDPAGFDRLFRSECCCRLSTASTRTGCCPTICGSSERLERSSTTPPSGSGLTARFESTCRRASMRTRSHSAF